jgi:SAM-dependent methyltransferase
MLDAIHELYEKREYPPMSHPLSDPAVSAVSARMSGLAVPHPRKARILEIGCCTGHNLIPLAQRWPESRFVGIDLAESSIKKANQYAVEIGLKNITFQAADLANYEPEDGPFDFIIAHGFFSWVPDAVKANLLDFCGKQLSPFGIATVSFNLESGWKPRQPVIEKARAIQQVRGCDEIEALQILQSLTEANNPQSAIILDMLAKGSEILPFDDFGPINDPWPLDRFVGAAAHFGLKWLGESNPSENIPRGLSPEIIRELKSSAADALGFQMAMDEYAGRTFRSGVLCRNDVVFEKVSTSVVLDFSVRLIQEPSDSIGNELFKTIQSFAPAAVAVREVLPAMRNCDSKAVLRQLADGIQRAFIQPRIEAVDFCAALPDFPKLDAFRLLCAQRELPLVDAWHVPCRFPEAHYQLLAVMDGSRSRDELAVFSKEKCPELAFKPWLQHLAARGMFA